MKSKILLCAFLILIIQGCATPHVVKVEKVGDDKLSCKEIVTEIEEAERFEKEARDERKVTGKNVAAAVFFWPALVGTYANTEEAIDAAKGRQEHLRKIYNDKKCK